MTLAEYPAEIRSPAGKINGVSTYQVQFSEQQVLTEGEDCTALVALNAAALKKHIPSLQLGGLLIIDSGSMNQRDLTKAGYDSNPVDTQLKTKYRVIDLAIYQLAQQALEPLSAPTTTVKRTRNFFVLGIILWIYNQPPQQIEKWLAEKERQSHMQWQANLAAFKAGYAYADTTEISGESWLIAKQDQTSDSQLITGNRAISTAILCAAKKLNRPALIGSYPITPASDIFEYLSQFPHLGITAFQAEDEIAAAAAALGASYSGILGVTATSGPGLSLKTETINLAVMAELPLVVINVQRAGPSTGMPTRTEQSDLFIAMFGRSGDSPLPVLAASSPADCFTVAMHACAIATRFMTPVIVLSDAYLAYGSESWTPPDWHSLPWIDTPLPQSLVTRSCHSAYQRDPITLSRPWAKPGTAEQIYQVGGLEKHWLSGEPCQDADNHQQMTKIRANKIKHIESFLPLQQVEGVIDAPLLVISWGSSYGAVSEAIRELTSNGIAVAHTHLRYLNPFPANLKQVVGNYLEVLVFELNNQQLTKILRAEFLCPAIGVTQVNGMPLKASIVNQQIKKHIRKQAHEYQ